MAEILHTQYLLETSLVIKTRVCIPKHEFQNKVQGRNVKSFNNKNRPQTRRWIVPIAFLSDHWFNHEHLKTEKPPKIEIGDKNPQ